jgi:hypothetical protein
MDDAWLLGQVAVTRFTNFAIKTAAEKLSLRAECSNERVHDRVWLADFSDLGFVLEVNVRWQDTLGKCPKRHGNSAAGVFRRFLDLVFPHLVRLPGNDNHPARSGRNVPTRPVLPLPPGHAKDARFAERDRDDRRLVDQSDG